MPPLTQDLSRLSRLVEGNSYPQRQTDWTGLPEGLLRIARNVFHVGDLFLYSPPSVVPPTMGPGTLPPQ